jgi:MFS family permease
VTERSLSNLSRLNFLVATMLTSFGAFVPAYLAMHGWSQTDIGLALSWGTVAAVAAQVPAGWGVDAAPLKRPMAGGAILATVAAALVIALWPSGVPVRLAEVVQNVAGCVLAPSIAAITLALSRQETLGERLGRNTRFAAFGTALAGVVLGLLGTWLNARVIFYAAAACGLAALWPLARIRAADIFAAPTRTMHAGVVPSFARAVPPQRVRELLRDRRLLIFAGCIALFQFANAPLLPLAAHVVVAQVAYPTYLVMAAMTVVPQLLAAALSPWFGRRAQGWLGRRRVLLAGFLAMTVRAVLFAIDGSPTLMIFYQALDGITAAVMGVMLPLVVADITLRGGRFNLALGIGGLAGALGATVAMPLAGFIADTFGSSMAFVALAGCGALGCLAVWRAMPNTRPVPQHPHRIAYRRTAANHSSRGVAHGAGNHRRSTAARHPSR